MHRLLILSVLAFLTPAAPQAEHLHSPWDDLTIAATDAPYQCPAPPEFAMTLDADVYYTDSHASVIDPVKKAASDKASAPPTHLGQAVGLAADAYLFKGSTAAAACVYSLLDAAAKADAWAGEMPHFQDVYIQNWLLSGTAIPYLKVRNSGVGTPQQDAEIQHWFRDLAQRVHLTSTEARDIPKVMPTTTTSIGPVLRSRPRASAITTRKHSCGASRPITRASARSSPTDRSWPR